MSNELQRYKILVSSHSHFCQRPQSKSGQKLYLPACSKASEQGIYAWRHNSVLLSMVRSLEKRLPNIQIYTDLDNMTCMPKSSPWPPSPRVSSPIVLYPHLNMATIFWMTVWETESIFLAQWHFIPKIWNVQSANQKLYYTVKHWSCHGNMAYSLAAKEEALATALKHLGCQCGNSQTTFIVGTYILITHW